MRSLILIATWIIMKASYAQNLVPNPSFENLSSCSINGGGLDSVIGWWGANSSSDAFHPCAVSSAYQAPSNSYGYQNAFDGNAYAFFLAYFGTPAVDRREYAESRLTTPLVNGTKYFVSMRVSFADDFQFATDGIGAFFSQDSVSGTGQGLIDSVPQIQCPNGVPLSDSTNWIMIAGSFIANGGEEYITIGNFKNDAQTNLQNLGGTANSGGYFLDAVCVSPDSLTCYNFVGVEEYEDQNSIKLYPNPANEVVYIESDNLIERLELYNLTGQLLHIEANTYRINVAALPKGIYLVRVFTEKGMASKRLIKQ